MSRSKRAELIESGEKLSWKDEAIRLGWAEPIGGDATAGGGRTSPLPSPRGRVSPVPFRDSVSPQPMRRDRTFVSDRSQAKASLGSLGGGRKESMGR